MLQLVVGGGGGGPIEWQFGVGEGGGSGASLEEHDVGEEDSRSLQAYKDINGDLLVPRSVVVPSGDIRWPREAWGYKLGDGVSHLRTRAAKQDLPPQLDAQLKEMGFVYGSSQFQWDEVIMPALRHYFKVNGHTDVSLGFVVPSGDSAWPRPTWGWKLGNTANSIRHKKTYSQQVRESEEELKVLKFCFKMSIAERNWSEKILPALRIYRQENYHCLVKKSFKVPSESPWPEETWRLPLGQVVNDIRMGNSYAEQTTRDKDILIQLGSLGIKLERECSPSSRSVCSGVWTSLAFEHVGCASEGPLASERVGYVARGDALQSGFGSSENSD